MVILTCVLVVFIVSWLVSYNTYASRKGHEEHDSNLHQPVENPRRRYLENIKSKHKRAILPPKHTESASGKECKLGTQMTS